MSFLIDAHLSLTWLCRGHPQSLLPAPETNFLIFTAAFWFHFHFVSHRWKYMGIPRVPKILSMIKDFDLIALYTFTSNDSSNPQNRWIFHVGARKMTGRALLWPSSTSTEESSVRTEKSHLGLLFEGTKQKEKSPWAKCGDTLSAEPIATIRGVPRWECQFHHCSPCER